MTNGDKIRQMSDKQLITNFRAGICCIIQETDPKWCKDQGSCEECQRKWLKKEVEE